MLNNTAVEKVRQQMMRSRDYYGCDGEDGDATPSLWLHWGDQVYSAAQKEELHTRVPAGFYNTDRGMKGPFLAGLQLQTDELVDFADGPYAEIIERLETFWTRHEEYQKYGVLHRIGLMLYGKQGCGKTALIQQICRRAVKRDHLVLLYSGDNQAFTGCVSMVRVIEPSRPLVLVIEDLDGVVGASWDITDFLQWMDGNNKTDNTIVLATTNYPQNIDKRITQRPRRFDRLIKIPVTTDDQRRTFFRIKLGPHIGESELNRWVNLSDGLTFAGLTELLVSVKCAAEKLEDAARQIYVLENPVEEPVEAK